jgi:hypothetical protein
MKSRLFDRQLPELTSAEKTSFVEIESRFDAAPWLKPAAGFGRRWLARWQAQQEANQRVRAGWIYSKPSRYWFYIQPPR